MVKKLLVVFMIGNYKRAYDKMSTYYPPYKRSSSNIKVELDLTNYPTKTDLKNITHTAFKTEVDKIDTGK